MDAAAAVEEEGGGGVVEGVGEKEERSDEDGSIRYNCGSIVDRWMLTYFFSHRRTSSPPQNGSPWAPNGSKFSDCPMKSALIGYKAGRYVSFVGVVWIYILRRGRIKLDVFLLLGR